MTEAMVPSSAVDDTEGLEAAPGETAGSEDSDRRGLRFELLNRVRENKLAVAAATMLLLVVLFSFIGPIFYHSNQTIQLLEANLPPGSGHLLGTSPVGQDELGQLMIAGQSTLEVGLGASLIATLFGALWGSWAGLVGGVVDAVMMRIVDALLAIPYLFFIIFVSALIQPNLWVIMLVIASGGWLSTARLARGEVLHLREMEYVAASQASGARRPHIIVRHLIPNLLGNLMVNGTLNVAYAILAFASISFLGAGLPPPATNWGAILTDGVNDLFDGYWWQLWPAAVLIVLTVLSVNVLGDTFGDLVESRLRSR